jgi:hypothetical protein
MKIKKIIMNNHRGQDMDKEFIIDKEINLNEYDFLKTKIYADNLTKIIENKADNKVFTIGLFGGWGTGKSSIIETSRQYFNQTKVKFVIYDAWQYVNDSFRRMFLRKLQTDLQYEKTDLMKNFYDNESTDIGHRYQISPKYLTFVFVAAVILLIALFIMPIELEYKFPAYSFFTLFGLFITIISGAFHKLIISVTKPHLFAHEQFEECFKEMISKLWNEKNENLKLEKLVIVIDNMDRCSSEVAYNLLTDIKTFLCNEPYNIIFIIPVDDTALRNHIINDSKTNKGYNNDKEEFLRKFFNLTIRIKPYGTIDMFSFAKQINERYRLNFKPETINIVSKEYAKNPRRIIQLFNNLLAELNYYDSEFMHKNETLICCILIIKEEYHSYYNKIINSPKCFTNLPVNNDDVDELKRFIRIAQSVVGQIDIADLNRILTNTSYQFNNLSESIRDAIDTYDDNEVLKEYEREKDCICDYIIYKLVSSIKNELIDSELVAYFDLCAKIHIKHPLENHICTRIDEHIISHLGAIINNTSNHENLCNYALHRETQQNNTIKAKIIEICKVPQDTAVSKNRNALFNAILKIFKDKWTAMELSSTYTNDGYRYVHESTEAMFTPDQFNYLITDEFVQQRIDELPTNDKKEIILDTTTDAYQKVKQLFMKKTNITEQTYNHLFVHIVGEKNDNIKMRGKTTNDIANLLQFIQPLLDSIPNRIFEEVANKSEEFVLSILYKLITSNRKMPNPNAPQNMNADSSVNFIDECIAKDLYVQDVIKFVTSIYRVTANTQDVIPEIKKLLPKYREQLNIEFIKLIEQSYNLKPIINFILEDKNYTNPNTLTLLKHSFNQKNDDGTYFVSTDIAKTKFNDLITVAYDQRINEIFDLLESLIAQEQYKNILSFVIVEKDSDFVNNLPVVFLKLALSSFNKDNYNDYEDNFDFMAVIIKHGEVNQKELVINIIVTKLGNNKDIQQVVGLLKLIMNVSKIDPDGLLVASMQRYLRDNSNNINDDLRSELKSQLKIFKKDMNQ